MSQENLTLLFELGLPWEIIFDKNNISKVEYINKLKNYSELDKESQTYFTPLTHFPLLKLSKDTLS